MLAEGRREPSIKRIFLEADSLQLPTRPNQSRRSDSGGLQKTGS